MTKQDHNPENTQDADAVSQRGAEWRGPLRADFLSLRAPIPTWPGLPKLGEGVEQFTVTRRRISLSERQLTHGLSRQWAGLLRGRAIHGRRVRNLVDLRQKALKAAEPGVEEQTSERPDLLAPAGGPPVRRAYPVRPAPSPLDSTTAHPHVTPRKAVARSWAEYIERPSLTAGATRPTGPARTPTIPRTPPTPDQLHSLLHDAEDSSEPSSPADLRVRRREPLTLAEPNGSAHAAPATVTQQTQPGHSRVRGNRPPVEIAQLGPTDRPHEVPGADVPMSAGTASAPEGIGEVPAQGEGVTNRLSPRPPSRFPRAPVAGSELHLAGASPSDHPTPRAGRSPVEVLNSSNHIPRRSNAQAEDDHQARIEGSAAQDQPSRTSASMPHDRTTTDSLSVSPMHQVDPVSLANSADENDPPTIPLPITPSRFSREHHTASEGLDTPKTVATESASESGRVTATFAPGAPGSAPNPAPGSAAPQADSMSGGAQINADTSSVVASTPASKDSLSSEYAALPTQTAITQPVMGRTTHHSGGAPVDGASRPPSADTAVSVAPTDTPQDTTTSPPLFSRALRRGSRLTPHQIDSESAASIVTDHEAAPSPAVQSSPAIVGAAETAPKSTNVTPQPQRRSTADKPAQDLPEGGSLRGNQSSPALAASEEQVTLPPDVRQAVASAIGQAPTSVPVRRGSAVGARARALRADAFTQGGVIHAPGTAPLVSLDDRRLLAHEATHLVQQTRLGAGLPTEGSARGQALEQQAMRAEQALSGGASQVNVGTTVPARRGASTRMGSAVAATSAPITNSSGSRKGNSATARSTPVAELQSSQLGESRSITSASAPNNPESRSSLSSLPLTSPVDRAASGGGEVSAPLGLAPEMAQHPSEQSREVPPSEPHGGANSSPVRSRSVPPIVPTPGSLEPRRALSLRAPNQNTVQGQTGVSSVAPVTSTAPTPVSSIQRRASRGPGNATIRAVGSQEDFVEAQPPKSSGGGRAWPTPATDTARDQEWLVRHAQALYPLMRNLLRAELLRDRERRGQMLKENF